LGSRFGPAFKGAGISQSSINQSCLIIACCVLMLLQAFTGKPEPVLAAAANPAQEMKAYVETIPGTTRSFEMVPIPGGSFMMGSPATEAGRSTDEGPQHEVAISPFWMQTLEVTWDEYDLFAFQQDLKKDRQIEAPANRTSADAITYPTPPYADEAFGYGKGRQPALSITHHAAMEYCRWLSEKTGKTYRLPTEAEWEYACRAGSKTAYSFGDDPAKLGGYAWYLDNSDGAPHVGGKKKPNAWGLFDMHGNLAEWCIDQYDKDFYSTFKSKADAPVLLPTERRYPRVVRGGSWDDEAGLLRSAARRGSKKEWSKRDPQRPQSIWWHTEAIMVGFRVVRPLKEQENLKGLRSKLTRQSPD
jgi:formylglycine-generating enzyme required for sulfatase activity